jgi:D-beta-D-heptose 7-phosphate kinase/D-beta-D-heptose 1-phosphate adenosyltransferase
MNYNLKKTYKQIFDLLNIVRLLKKSSILVVGDVMIDKFIFGTTTKISQEAPVPIVEIKKETEALGGAANVLNNIVSFGAKAFIVGVIGNDAAGTSIIRKLSKKEKSYNCLIKTYDRPTTVKSRIIASGQQIVRIDRENRGFFGKRIEKKIIYNIKKNIHNVDAIVISDYGKGVISDLVIKNISFLSKKYKIPVLVDPKFDNFKKYKNVNVITPNEKEAIDYMNMKNIKTDNDIVLLGNKIIDLLCVSCVVITRGEKGIVVVQQNNNVINIPSRSKEVYDVTGAGDTIISVMSLVLSVKFDLLSAAEIANFAAGIVVGKVGTATTNSNELIGTIKDFYKNEINSNNTI